LQFLGIELEMQRNAENAALISSDAGNVAVRVIRTNEEQMIGQTVCRVLGFGVASETKSFESATIS